MRFSPPRPNSSSFGTLFWAQKSTQADRLFFPAASTSKDTFMVRAAPLSSVDSLSHSLKNPARRKFVLATTIQLALQVTNSELSLAAGENTASCNQSGFVRSAFVAYTNVVNDVKGPERGERVMVGTMESWDVRATRRKRPELKSSSLYRELVSRPSQPKDLVAELLPTFWRS